MKNVKFEDIKDGDQFIGVWSHNGEIWSETYVKSGNGVLPYVLYDEDGDCVDDFSDVTSVDVNHSLSLPDFKAYIL